MFIRLSTYLYGCRFCWDALDSAKKSRWHYGPSKLITAALAERIQTTPILYSVHDELCYVYIYIYVPTCFFCLFLPSILCFFAYMVSMRNFAIVFLPLAFGKPHVLFVLVDDLGWANVGFNRDPPIPKSVVTPNLDRLAGH